MHVESISSDIPLLMVFANGWNTNVSSPHREINATHTVKCVNSLGLSTTCFLHPCLLHVYILQSWPFIFTDKTTLRHYTAVSTIPLLHRVNRRSCIYAIIIFMILLISIGVDKENHVFPKQCICENNLTIVFVPKPSIHLWLQHYCLFI